MMMILKVQEGADVANMPEELLAAIASVRGEFAEGIMVGTKPVDGWQIVLINADATAWEIEFLTNNDEFDEDGKQIAFDLGWQVLAVEGEKVDQKLLLPYFVDQAVYNEETGDFDFEPVTDLTGKIQHWAGKEWQY